MHYHFDCVFYYVTDLDRAVAFYTDIFGLAVTSRDVVVRFKIDGVLFELVEASDPTKLQGSGNARLCLNVEDLAQAVTELHAQGIPTSPVQEVENEWLASCEDPDGNELCLWQYREEKV